MGVLGKNNWFLRASGTPSPAAAAIVHPSPHEEHAMRWHTPKSKSEVSCGFAGSQVFCFSSQKWRKVLKTLGFSGVPRSGTLFEKLLVFRGSVRLLRLSARLEKRPLTILGQRGVVMGKHFASSLFFSRVIPYTPVKTRSAVLRGCSRKGSLTLLPQHEGRKNDTFFRFFSKFFWRPLSLRPACRIVAYTSNDRRTHNTKAARLIPDRDKQVADD